MSLTAGDKIGSYEILAPIGAGGMGEVYRARDTKLDRDVAIKVLPAALAQDADRLARFEREARVLAAVNHPNIAIIHGLEETSGNARAIVMELVEGPTLADRLASGALPLAEALAIARQIADALEAAHEKGVVHRDLKPANVKVRDDGTVKVLDFGLATAVQGNAHEPGVGANSPTLTLGATQIGMILGTAAYMAPEQAEGKAVDRRADIWSFGVVLWEMLTGKRLFDAETVPLTLADVLRKEVDFKQVPEDTPAPVRDLLKRCLDRDVKNRLQWIGEARVAIQKYQANPTPAVVEVTPLVVVQRTRPIWWIAIAALFALAAGGLGFVHFRETPPTEHALRYTIDPPQNGDVLAAALSPDGRYVVMAAAVSGKRQLWLRPLDALQAQPLPTTEDAAYPFWSPDSRYIGFFAQGNLKKIAASGGPAQSLCEAANGRGGTWNRDDVILFSPTNGPSGLQRVPASGGVPAAIKDKGDYRYPVFLPDGIHFLYTSRGGTPETQGIYLGSLDGKENRRILGDISESEFVRSGAGNRGHILFVRGSTLMAQPFDAASRQTSGDVFPVAEGISLAPNDSGVISGAETGLLLFGNRGANAGGNQIAWFDRTGKQLSLVGMPGNVYAPAISPNEKTLAFSRSGVIQLRDLTRDTDIRFTNDPSGDYMSFWSPQGDRIVFTSDRGGSYGLYEKLVGGSGPGDVLVASAHRPELDQWSWDGKFIVYAEQDPKTKLDLWVLPIDPATGKSDGKPVPFLHTEFNELHGQISPDGNWMAFTSDDSGKREVYVQPFPKGDGHWKISTAGGDQPRWRRDGSEIYYVAADGKMTAVQVLKALPASNGVVADFQMKAPEPLFESHIIATETTSRVFQYDVTRDGKKFVVVTPASVNATGSTPLTVELNWLARLKK